MLAAALTVVALLFLTGLFEDLPEATLAAVVIAAVVELVDVRALVDLYNTYTKRLGRQFGWVARPDFIAARRRAARRDRLRDAARPVHRHRRLARAARLPRLAAIRRRARPRPGPDGAYRDVGRHPTTLAPPTGSSILRIESGLYFANAENVRARILDAGGAEGVRAVILDAETIPFVDVTAARMLVATHEELRTHGVRLVLARAVGQVRDVLGCITRRAT